MVDSEDVKLKAEIDAIVTKINATIKKIVDVVPLTPPGADQVTETITQEDSQLAPNADE